jgi:hypothetical protein
MKLTAICCAAAVVFVVPAFAQTNDRPMTPGWITTTNKPCRVWNPEPQANESVTWSGPCKDGYASGKGVLLWTENGKPDVEYQGEYQNGKRNGHGVIIAPDGTREEGDWFNDLPLAPDRTGI